MKIVLNKELTKSLAQLTLHKPDLNIIPETDNYPWFIQEFQSGLQKLHHRNELLLPNLKEDNDCIAIFSDYSGESTNSRYYTYSFLICAYQHIRPFINSMNALRRTFGLATPFKEIAFKHLNYGPLARALPEYLRLLNNLVNGYLLTVIVDKSVGSLFGPNNKSTYDFLLSTLSENDLGKWKPDVAEKMLRVLHYSAYLVALLSRQGQKVFWMTDDDCISANTIKFSNTLNLFSRLLRHYCPHELSIVGGAIPFRNRSVEFTDLLSATDIIAGSVAHHMNHKYKKSDPTESKKENEIQQVLEWLSIQGVALKRHAVLIRKENDNYIHCTLRFKTDHKILNTVVVPVVVK